MIDSLFPSWFSPALILIVGGLAVPLVSSQIRKFYMLGLCALAAWQLWSTPIGTFGELEFLGYALELVRLDRWSLPFAVIFIFATTINVIYGWHVEDSVQQSAQLVYPGAALGGVLAGDLITLFVYWEIAAVASVFLIWAGGTDRAIKAGMRYIVIQVGSGVFLLGGVVLFAAETGSVTFNQMNLDSVGTAFIFFAFGIKCAFPLLHNWIQDSYPESTVSGTIVLSVFTTKLAVYSLLRGFPGQEQLIWLGTTMTLFPIFFAVIEDNLRRVLTYSINNQVGFMVVAIGIGTPFALNGAVGYAFCNIIFESLLFMSMGAVLYRAGTIQASELGGLYKSMPWTAVFCIVGALSISAFPLFAGFVTKGLIIDSVADAHLFVIWLALLFASAGVLEHAGIKIPYFGFFGHDSGKKCEEAPRHMLVAMAVSAILCVAIGVYPEPLYALLPEPIVGYVPYTVGHVVTQLQLLLFAILAFVFLVRVGVYPPEIKSTNLDTDWFYRKAAPALIGLVGRGISAAQTALLGRARRQIDLAIARLYRYHGPAGQLARSWPAGSMALWIAILLAVSLIVNYLSI